MLCGLGFLLSLKTEITSLTVAVISAKDLHTCQFSLEANLASLSLIYTHLLLHLTSNFELIFWQIHTDSAPHLRREHLIQPLPNNCPASLPKNTNKAQQIGRTSLEGSDSRDSSHANQFEIKLHQQNTINKQTNKPTNYHIFI